MYCVNCGVELSDSEKRCPLCKTVVYHPDIKQQDVKPQYPPYEDTEPKVNPKGILLVISIFFGLIAGLALLIDIKLTYGPMWSGYAIGGLTVVYITVILPVWFKLPNPVIFSAVDFAVAALFLMYINYATGGHWFLTLGLPVTAFAGIVIVGIIALLKYVKKGYLYIFGGALILQGIFTVGVEMLINYTFNFEHTYFWSIYPLISCALIGIMIIVIAICKPLKNILHKKFFI